MECHKLYVVKVDVGGTKKIPEKFVSVTIIESILLYCFTFLNLI